MVDRENEADTDANDSLRHWRFREYDYRLGARPLLMGIVNVTPDSFSDAGRFLKTEDAVAHALQLVEDGADILDVGGESTRPGSSLVAAEEEWNRVVPVIRELASQTEVPISIDTTKAEVARRAIAAGAVIVNDISGLTFDAEMPRVCAELETGVICMHIQGTPQNMQDDPQYGDVVGEICDILECRIGELETAGIPRERVVIDPGVGFGKTAAHNIAILSNIHRIRNLGRPVLIGHSRKRFLAKVIGRTVDERESGTLGVSAGLAVQSIDILRVHDVRSTRDCLAAMATILEKTRFFDS